MIFLAGAAALAVAWLLGALVLGVLGLRGGDATDLPLELATGATVIGAVGSVLVVAGVPLSPLYIYAVLLAVAVVSWRKRRPPTLRPPAWPADPVARGLLVAAAAVVVLILTASLVDRLSWDGWAIWVLKARILLLEGGLPADAWTRPGPFEFAHPDYPLALPLFDWWLFAHAGRPVPALASFAGAIWFSLLPWLLWAGAGAGRPRAARARAASAAALGLAAFWPIASYAVGGTADVLMALAILGAAVELERGARSGTTAPLIRAMLYLLLAALTKNEGLAVGLAGGAIVGAILVRRRQRGAWAYLAAAAPTAAGLLWRAWSSGMGAEVEQLGSSFGLVELGRNAASIARALGELALYRQWPPLLLVVGVGAWRWRARRLRSQTPAWALLGIYLAMVMGVYLMTDQDLPWLLETSLQRVLSTLVPAAVYLTVRGLEPRESV